MAWDHSCLKTGETPKGHKRRTCKDCKSVYAKQRRKTEKGKAEDKRHNDETRRTRMEWAKSRVMVEVRAGRMPPASDLPCVDCGKQAEVYDHRDYDKPLDVEPVCKTHNKLRGPGKNRLISPEKVRWIEQCLSQTA